MFRGAIGSSDPCEAKDARGIPSYPFGQRSVWTEDAQRYANKYLIASGKRPLQVTGVLDSDSCAAFSAICVEQERAAGFPMRLQSIEDPLTCDQIPCYLDSCEKSVAPPQSSSSPLLTLNRATLRNLGVRRPEVSLPGDAAREATGRTPVIVLAALGVGLVSFVAWKMVK